MVIIDHKTGNVVATIGGLGEKTESRCFNRATQSVRQTGSAIKPIAVLAPAIDKKKITSSEIVNDTERDFEKGYHPVDYSKPLGNITVRRAVESSQNVPFVEIMEKIKPSTSIKYLKKMGISTLTEKDEGLPLSLGGLDKGISPLEMAGAYSTIANDGIYIEPTFYSKIDKKNNETIVKPKQKKRRVFSKEVAYILKEILTQPVQGENGTATYCKISGVDVAAKTGTTDENYDRWLCGFTPYYTAVTWYGYDINESVDFNRKNPAGLIWANVMSRIHTGLKNATFEKPNGIIEATICTESGKKAKTGCTHTYTEYFLWGTVPGLCNKHSGNEFNETKGNKNNNANTNGTVQGITNDIDAEEPQRTSPIIIQEDNQEKSINQTNNNSTNTTNEETSNNTTNSNETNTTNTSNNIKNELTNNTNTNVSNTTNSATNQTNTADNNLTLDKTNTTSTNNDV